MTGSSPSEPSAPAEFGSEPVVAPEAIPSLLSRPAEQRLRECKYRCAQAFVFGVPVFLLHWFGGALGGPEAVGWAGVLQALLAGWVIYVAAAGPLFEGVLLLKLRRRISADLLISSAAIAIYFYSLVVLGFVLLHPGHSGAYPPLLFHISIALPLVWAALGWRRYATLPQH